ncbi:hypothetical protein F0562_013069 [Nyssa sinensis]|uniref:Uncharacterized protein n=1 Tax=Nyssa sinensis TaxID=561372 RepID=A0A5J4ZW15_9ASTE|nr:hypothetical protein F0562_013069 [Nyssa sinensis]
MQWGGVECRTSLPEISLSLSAPPDPSGSASVGTSGGGDEDGQLTPKLLGKLIYRLLPLCLLDSSVVLGYSRGCGDGGCGGGASNFKAFGVRA